MTFASEAAVQRLKELHKSRSESFPKGDKVLDAQLKNRDWAGVLASLQRIRDSKSVRDRQYQERHGMGHIEAACNADELLTLVLRTYESAKSETSPLDELMELLHIAPAQ